MNNNTIEITEEVAAKVAKKAMEGININDYAKDLRIPYKLMDATNTAKCLAALREMLTEQLAEAAYSDYHDYGTEWESEDDMLRDVVDMIPNVVDDLSCNNMPCYSVGCSDWWNSFGFFYNEYLLPKYQIPSDYRGLEDDAKAALVEARLVLDADKIEETIVEYMTNLVNWKEAFGGIDIFAMMNEDGAAACREYLADMFGSFAIMEGLGKYFYLFNEDDEDYCEDDDPSEILADAADSALSSMIDNLDYNLERHGCPNLCDSPYTPFGQLCYDWLTEEYQDPQTMEKKKELLRAGLIKDSWQRLTDNGTIWVSWEDEEWYA